MFVIRIILIIALVTAKAAASGGYSSFSYGVSDPNTGDIKDQDEKRIGHTVVGHYSLLEADGSKRIVEYSADPYTGFKAVVKKDPPVQSYSNSYASPNSQNSYNGAVNSYANQYTVPNQINPYNQLQSDPVSNTWTDENTANSYLNGWSEPGHPTTYTDTWNLPTQSNDGWNQFDSVQSTSSQVEWNSNQNNGPEYNGNAHPTSYVNALTPAHNSGYNAGHGQPYGVYGQGPISYEYKINHGNYASQYKW